MSSVFSYFSDCSFSVSPPEPPHLPALLPGPAPRPHSVLLFPSLTKLTTLVPPSLLSFVPFHTAAFVPDVSLELCTRPIDIFDSVCQRQKRRAPPQAGGPLTRLHVFDGKFSVQRSDQDHLGVTLDSCFSLSGVTPPVRKSCWSNIKVLPRANRFLPPPLRSPGSEPATAHTWVGFCTGARDSSP